MEIKNVHAQTTIETGDKIGTRAHFFLTRAGTLNRTSIYFGLNTTGCEL